MSALPLDDSTHPIAPGAAALEPVSTSGGRVNEPGRSGARSPFRRPRGPRRSPDEVGSNVLGHYKGLNQGKILSAYVNRLLEPDLAAAALDKVRSKASAVSPLQGLGGILNRLSPTSAVLGNRLLTASPETAP